MKYVLLAYADEHQLAVMSAREREELVSACRANDEALRKSGQLLAVDGLEHSCAAATIRMQNSNMSITIGPAVEAREQLIGIFTITARDFNEAIQIAANMPQARSGPIEVRPLAALDHLW